MADHVILVDHVTKRFAGHTAVRDMMLEVPRGGIYGLLGPNGAGKSTTIRMIMNIITPDEGRIQVLGGQSASRDLSDRIGYLPEERGLYKKMKVLDHLTFFGEAKGIRRYDAKTKAIAWLDRLGLTEWTLHKVEDLSKGMQQKVQFISALLHDPELILLDEPFSGLDPVNAKVMKETVIDLSRQGRTILFSTHIMEQAEKMCDRIAIIARGEKIVDGRLTDVKRDFGQRHVALAFSAGAEKAAGVLQDRSLVANVVDSGASAEVELVGAVEPDQLLRALVNTGVSITRFEVVEPSLEAIFIAKVGADALIAPAREAVHG